MAELFSKLIIPLCNGGRCAGGMCGLFLSLTLLQLFFRLSLISEFCLLPDILISKELSIYSINQLSAAHVAPVCDPV